jgi:polyisoprenoid-binding protein YceI
MDAEIAAGTRLTTGVPPRVGVAGAWTRDPGYTLVQFAVKYLGFAFRSTHVERTTNCRLRVSGDLTLRELPRRVVLDWKGCPDDHPHRPPSPPRDGPYHCC